MRSRSPGDSSFEITPEKLDDHVDILNDYADAVGVAVSFTPEAFTTSLTLEAESIDIASGTGFERVRTVAEKVGLPAWPVVSVWVMTAEETDAQLAEPTYPPVLGIAELADMLRTSKQRASQVARTQNFPRPYAELASGPVWLKPNVMHFVENWERRPGRPRKVDA